MKDISSTNEGDAEAAYLSLFTGYDGGMKSDGKLMRLVEEALGCAVLDSG